MQTIKIKGSITTALTSGVSTLNYRELAITIIDGYKRFYVGDSANKAREIGGDAYALLESPALTGTPTAPTATAGTNDTQIANTQFVSTAISNALVGGVKYKATIDCSTNPNYPAALAGDLYIVSASGKIGGTSGKKVEVSDWVICKVDSASGNEASVGANFDVIQGNIDLDVLAGAGLVVNGSTVDVDVDNSTIQINGSNQVTVKDAGITEDKINSSSLALTGGLTGASGSKIAIKPDITTGATIAPITIGSNGAGMYVDNVSIIHTAGELSVALVDGGTF
jgi:hypothetical protein